MPDQRLFHYTLSGRIGKVVASHASVARSIPAEVALIYNMHEALRGTAHEGGRSDQSIGSTVFDAIVRSWLWLTATRSSSLGRFSTLLQVIIDPTFCGSRFYTMRPLAIEDFTIVNK